MCDPRGNSEHFAFRMGCVCLSYELWKVVNEAREGKDVLMSVFVNPSPWGLFP